MTMRACKPLRKGCVLDEKVRYIGEESDDMIEPKVEILDLRPMPPFERHEKIFKVWAALKAGDTLQIINDHDPKPLRYQFEVEYKDKYEWEYEEKGPKDWVVNIKKRG